MLQVFGSSLKKSGMSQTEMSQMRRHHNKLFIALSNILKRLVTAPSQKIEKMTHVINVWKCRECCGRVLTNNYQGRQAHIVPKRKLLAIYAPKKYRKGSIVTWTIQAMAWTFWEYFPLHSTWLESSNQHLAKVKSQCERALPGDCTASLMALFGAWPAQPVDTIRFRLFRLPGPIWSQFMISDGVHLSPAASSCLPVTRSLHPAGSLFPVPLPSTPVFAVTVLECVPMS